jgi:DNA-nicking Smr family endonuclease
MRKKKRREREAAAANPQPAPTPGIYRPFRELRDKLPVPETGPAGKGVAQRREGAEGVGSAEEARSRGKGLRAGAEAEGSSFVSAMSGVTPLEHAEPPGRKSVPPPPAVDEFEVAERFLARFVDGDVPFDFTDTGEYMQGSVQGLDLRLVHRLRRGDYAVEGHLDLHGLDRHEAKQALRDFIVQSRKDGKRCVLVVHGRGLGSKDGVPVLRERTREWLSRGGIGRQVLAFTSARPADGGTGAVYVLLRR